MKLFAVVVSLLFAIPLLIIPSRCHANPYDELDVVTAQYARGYVPDSVLMDIVHSLTPDTRKRVQDLRRRIAKRKDQLKEEEKKVEKARKRVENRKSNYQQARRGVSQYSKCMKEQQQQYSEYGQQLYKSCGDENVLMDERDRKYKELEKAERQLIDALSDYRHIRDLIKKLENALAQLLKTDKPKPSVEPRPYKKNYKNNDDNNYNNKKKSYGDYGGNNRNSNNYRSANGYSNYRGNGYHDSYNNNGYGSYGKWR